MLSNNYSGHNLEAGCDEAGRGCLAGPVFAAAVILPQDFYESNLNDSKVLSEKSRLGLRKIIEKEALAWSVAKFDPAQIDTYNILWASVRCMHQALDTLSTKPEFIIVDGNKFLPYQSINHKCIIKGDSKFASIAAASILAKTHRDEYMTQLHDEFPQYSWHQNKGYPTSKHREAISAYGATIHHRLSFQLLPQSKSTS